MSRPGVAYRQFGVAVATTEGRREGTRAKESSYRE